MTTYSVEFVPAAQKEWRKLDVKVRQQFAAKLEERRHSPRVLGDKLKGDADTYKIKQRSSGFRLIYEVVDERLIVLVLAINTRERLKAYRKAEQRRPSR